MTAADKRDVRHGVALFEIFMHSPGRGLEYSGILDASCPYSVKQRRILCGWQRGRLRHHLGSEFPPSFFFPASFFIAGRVRTTFLISTNLQSKIPYFNDSANPARPLADAPQPHPTCSFPSGFLFPRAPPSDGKINRVNL